ncbi:MAG: O-antigen ligase family protein [Candidatus Omnitrophota bacterium]
MFKKLLFIAFIWYLPLQLKLPNFPIFPMINILFILLTGVFLSSRNEKFVRPRFETPLMFFLIIWMFSFVYACMFTDGMPRVEIAREFKRLYLLPLGYFILSRCITDKKEIPFYFAAFLLCLVFAGHNTLRNGVLAGANYAIHKRSSGPFGTDWQASDIAGGYIATFTPLLVSFFFFSRQRMSKLLSAVGVGACGLGLMATYSRGSMMALLFACIAIVIVGTNELAKESKINFLVIIIGLVVGCVFWKAWVPQSIIARVEGTIELDDEEKDYYDYSLTDDEGDSVLDQSSQLRMKAWNEGLQFFMDNPLTGIGFRQVQFQLGHDPHNTFVLIASEMGAVGFLIFVWLIFSVMGHGFRLMGTEYNNLAVGTVGMMVGFIVVNCFYSNFFRDNVAGSFWVILAIIAAADNFRDDQSDSTNNNSDLPGNKRQTYAEYRKKYLKSVLFIFFVFCFTSSAMASEVKIERWWSEKNVSHLSVLDDLKPGLTGEIYYVDGLNGNDNNYGNSLKFPFKNIGRGIQNLKAGDILLIKAGIYKEKLWIQTAGTPEKPVIIGPYGDGEVILDASLEIDSWQPYKGNIYKVSCSKEVGAVVIDENPLFPNYNLYELSENQWYYDIANKLLYVYLKNGENPNNHPVGVVEYSKYNHAVFLNGARHVFLYGLTVRYAGGKGIEILGPYNRIEQCNIKFNAAHGIGMFRYENQHSDYTSVVKNHVYHNFLINWPRGRWPYKNGGWGMGIAGSASENGVITGNVVHKNGGEGIGVPVVGGQVIDNIVYDNWSVNIYSDSSSKAIIDRNLIYCEDIDPADLTNNKDERPWDGRSLKRLRAEGIMTADEDEPALSHDLKITNNIIIGCRKGVSHYGPAAWSGLKDVLVAHNTIILPDADGIWEDFVGINVPWNEGNNAGTVYRNNIVYATHKDTLLVNVAHDPLYRIEPFHGIAFDHNIWYHTSRKKPFYFGIPLITFFQDYDFKGWLKRGEDRDIDRDSQYKDPMFVNRIGFTAESVKLMKNSPAVNSGKIIEGLKTDYMGNPRDERPDIGALEVMFQ